MSEGSARKATARGFRVRPRPYDFILVAVIGVVLGGLIVPYVRSAETVSRQVETALAPEAAGGVGPGGGSEGPGSGSQGMASGGAEDDGGDGPGAPRSDGDGTGAHGGTGDLALDAGPAEGGGPVVLERGLTENEIHVGIGLLDIGLAKEFGVSFDIGDSRARYDALIAHVNDSGGIHGRKIVPHYRTLVAGKNETMQAACVGWIRDDKVFAVFATTNFPQAATVCVIGEGNTPLFASDGLDESYYANGRFFSTQPHDNRVLHDQVQYLLDNGSLEGKTIGVLSGDGAERLAIDNTLVPMLAAAGHEVETIEVVPAEISGSQRMPIAVSNFKAAGVDLVIVAANTVLAGPFVQTASRAGFNPEYALSDFNQQINDQVASYYPDSFDGTIGISTRRFPEYRAGEPLSAADRACIDRVQPVDPKVMPTTNAAHEVAMHECGVWDTFVQGAIAAGPNLSRDALTAGIESLGNIALAGLQDASFGPGKHDGGAFVREVVWRKSCKCWQVAGPVRAMR